VVKFGRIITNHRENQIFINKKKDKIKKNKKESDKKSKKNKFFKKNSLSNQLEPIRSESLKQRAKF
jgi:hypothetical protein